MVAGAAVEERKWPVPAQIILALGCLAGVGGVVGGLVARQYSRCPGVAGVVHHLLGRLHVPALGVAGDQHSYCYQYCWHAGRITVRFGHEREYRYSGSGCHCPGGQCPVALVF